MCTEGEGNTMKYAHNYVPGIPVWVTAKDYENHFDALKGKGELGRGVFVLSTSIVYVLKQYHSRL